MKIAFFTDTYLPEINGLAISVSTFATLLSKKHTIRIYAPAYKLRSSNAFEGDIEVVRFASIPLLIHKDSHLAFISSHAMIKSILDFKPDIIHVHTPATLGAIGLLHGKTKHIPLIGTYHTLVSEQLMYASPFRLIPGFDSHVFDRPEEGDDLSQKLVWRMSTAFYNQCQAIIVPTAAIEEALKDHGAQSPIHVVSNGINIELFQPKKTYTDRPALLYTGRLGFEKNINIVIAAFARIQKEIPDAHLTICGEGPALDSLLELSDNLGLSKSVTFVGWVKREDLVQIYQKHSVFMTASTMETQGLVVLEAMACGLPIVAVSKYALSQMVIHEKTGFLVQPFEEAEMADYCIQLLKDTKLQQKMGKNARKVALSHDVRKMARKLEGIYASYR